MATDMTPLDKAREALAAVEKATAGPWVQSGCIIRAYDANGACVMALYDEGGHDEPDAAAIVSAVNFVRADLPALIAEHERLADRVAKLEAGLSNLYGRIMDAWPELGHLPPMIEARALLTPTKGAEG